MSTKDFKPKKPAKVLIIGHDPRLQSSDTEAEFALFADYYFKADLKGGAEKRKHGLAKSTFEQVFHLTGDLFKADEIYVTNLCNHFLPASPNYYTVFIPEQKASEGISDIREILKENPTIQYIFPMSLQVNYWLQKLAFYEGDPQFVSDTEPRPIGVDSEPPYFTPKKSKTFLTICGNIYTLKEGD